MDEKNKSVKRIPNTKVILMVFTLGIAYFFSNFHRLSLGIIGNEISSDFNLTSAQLGFLGSIFFYAYGAMQIPSGIIVDKMGAKTIITLSCVLTAISTFAFSLSTNLTALIITRGLTGLAVAFIYVPALTALRQWFDDKVLGTMIGILTSMGQLGSVFASVPLRIATDMFGWRNTFRIISYITFILSILILTNVMNKNKVHDNSGKIGNNMSNNKCMHNPGFLSIALWFFFAGGTRMAFQGLWGSQYFTKVLESSGEFSSVLLMLISIGCVIGAIISGRLADRYGSIKTLIISSIIIAIIWFIMTGFNSNTPVVFLVLICLTLGVAGSGGFTIAFSCVREFSGKSNTGVLTGINNCAAFFGSAVITQYSGIVVGMLENFSLNTRYTILLFSFGVICSIMTLCITNFNKGKII